jgi:ATP-dependent Clp protease protease subunit
MRTEPERVRGWLQPPPGTSLTDALHDRLLGERIVMLGDELDDDRANTLCSELVLLAAESDRDISLYINSAGGSPAAAMAVYDTVQYLGNNVATVAIGLAASTAGFLLCAGTPGKRYALPHARVVINQPTGRIDGTAADIAIRAEQLQHTRWLMQRLLAEHTGQPLEQIERDTDRERWFTAEEAREYGLVDHVRSRMT